MFSSLRRCLNEIQVKDQQEFFVRLLISVIEELKSNVETTKKRIIPRQFIKEYLFFVKSLEEIFIQIGFRQIDDDFEFDSNKSDKEVEETLKFLVSFLNENKEQIVDHQEIVFDEIELFLRRNPWKEINWISNLRQMQIYEKIQLKNEITSRVVQLNEIRCRVERNIIDQNEDVQLLIVVQLLKWFKEEYFQWFNGIDCDQCQIPMEFDRIDRPNATELNEGQASRVEIYRCSKCSSIFRFARYNDVRKLIETRSGRCGEATNLFNCFCRCLSIECRFVFDPSDHVWTEIYSNKERRWIHCDPSENIFDCPLIYQHGWKKEIRYCFAFGRNHLEDVTWKYSNQFHLTRIKRNTDEIRLSKFIGKINKYFSSKIEKELFSVVVSRRIDDLVLMFKEKELDENNELNGRQSGSIQWRLNRSEIEQSDSKTKFIDRIEKFDLDENFSLRIDYDSLEDVYYRNRTKIEGGWSNRVYSSSNIQRKIEKDWKMVYLSRKSNFSSGELIWNFEIVDKSLSLNRVDFICPQTKFDDFSRIDGWISIFDEKIIPIDFDSTGSFQFDFQNIENNDKIRSISFKVVLSSSNDDKDRNSWQKGQLVRQSTVNRPLQQRLSTILTIQLNFSVTN